MSLEFGETKAQDCPVCMATGELRSSHLWHLMLICPNCGETWMVETQVPIDTIKTMEDGWTDLE